VSLRQEGGGRDCGPMGAPQAGRVQLTKQEESKNGRMPINLINHSLTETPKH